MLKVQPLSGQVYELLLRMILSGELSPGTPLREMELSAKLGVSRTPIREALGRLAEYGVVYSRPNHGVFVRHLGREELIHIHQVREALEGMSVTLACGRLNADDFAHLDALAEASRDSDSPDYFAAFDAFDVELHRLVAERTGNPILAQEIRKLHEMTMLIHDQVEWVLLGDQRIRPGEPKEFRRICWVQHVEILDALRARDAPASREAMTRHVREACVYKARLMPEDDPAGKPKQSRPRNPVPASLPPEAAVERDLAAIDRDAAEPSSPPVNRQHARR